MHLGSERMSNTMCRKGERASAKADKKWMEELAIGTTSTAGMQVYFYRNLAISSVVVFHLSAGRETIIRTYVEAAVVPIVEDEFAESEVVSVYITGENDDFYRAFEDVANSTMSAFADSRS
jgi:hypothetical protein